MADTPKKPSKEKDFSPEADEIPPDTDIKNQYKAENYIQNQNAVNQQYQNIQNVNIYQNKNHGEEYQIMPNNIVNQINQQSEVYQSFQEGQQSKFPLSSQKYEIIQENIGYNINQQNNDNSRQIYQVLGQPKIYQEFQSEEYQESQSPNINQQEIFEIIQNSKNSNIQLNENQLIQEGQGGNLEGYQMAQEGNLYKIIRQESDYNNGEVEYSQSNQMEGRAYQLSGSRNIEEDFNEYNNKSKSNYSEIRQKLKRNKEPKDSLSKVHIKSKKFGNSRSGLSSRNYKGQSIIRKIPPLISFQNISSKKIKQSKTKTKKENFIDFVEIPREEYAKYADTETLFFEGGMNTGQYTFRGKETVIKQEDMQGKIEISEDEIAEELSKRTNRKEKKIKYEIMDKFFSLTEFERKNIKENELQQIEIENNEEILMQGNNENKKEMLMQAKNENNNELLMQGENENNENNNFEYKYEQAQISSQQNLSVQKMAKSGMRKEGGKSENNYSGQYQSENMNYKINNQYSINESNSPMDNYSKYLLEQINKIRIDPQSFIGVIEDAKANIVKSRFGGYAYNGKIKIALAEGEPAFDDAIEFLKSTESMEILEYSPLLMVKLPQNESEIKDFNDLKIKVEEMLEEGINIKSYWRDIIRDPEISFLLMIVDDTGSRRGMKRKDILNPKMKYIGISSIEINGSFVCYITLSSNLTF